MRDYQAEVKKYQSLMGVLFVVALAFTVGLGLAALLIKSGSMDIEYERLDNGTRMTKYSEVYDPIPIISNLTGLLIFGTTASAIFGSIWALSNLREEICAECEHHRRRHFDKNDKPFDVCQFKSCGCKEFK